MKRKATQPDSFDPSAVIPEPGGLWYKYWEEDEAIKKYMQRLLPGYRACSAVIDMGGALCFMPRYVHAKDEHGLNVSSTCLYHYSRWQYKTAHGDYWFRLYAHGTVWNPIVEDWMVDTDTITSFVNE